MMFQEPLDLLTERLSSWVDLTAANLPNLILAGLLLLAFFLGSKPVARGFSGAVERMNASRAIVTLSAGLARILLILAGVLIACGVLGLSKTIFSLLAGAGVVGIALGFAFQDLVSNLIAGVVMGLRKPFQVGDHVVTGEYEGHVQSLNLRNTLVRTFEGQVVVIPNRRVFEQALVNYTTEGKRRIDVEVGVSYDTDLEKAVSAARAAVEELEQLDPDEEVSVIAKAFGASAIDLDVHFWIPSDASFLRARHDAVIAIHRVFEDEGITIPFPIRTLDLGLAEEALHDLGEARASA